MSKSQIFKFSATIGAAALALSIGSTAVASDKARGIDQGIWGIGKGITEEAIKPWDISIFFDGTNLPEGSGDMARGEEIYNAQCAMCHGDFGEGARGYPRLLGDPIERFEAAAKAGEDTLGIRGLNNHWGHAPTLLDMIRRQMPMFAPQSLSWDDAYAVTCYTLYLTDIVTDWDFVCSQDNLAEIKMPGRDHYYTDPRPDHEMNRCMKDCHDGNLEVVGAAVTGVAVGQVERRDRN